MNRIAKNTDGWIGMNFTQFQSISKENRTKLVEMPRFTMVLVQIMHSGIRAELLLAQCNYPDVYHFFQILIFA